MAILITLTQKVFYLVPDSLNLIMPQKIALNGATEIIDTSRKLIEIITPF
ncbi:MAG: hypothetical protein ACI8PB_003853 [Desulforhopalus sp.]|jgi:hypothetical protein